MNKILGWLVGLLGVVALVFRGQYHKEKAERAQEDVNREKNVNKALDRSSEAMIAGVTNEQKNYHSDTRPDFDPERKL